ncbi:MAG: hypothetical protein KA965_14065 [Butyrivibrio sp.]|nr:hypothetical protein [Butyrivibrio sp.]
MNVEKTKKYDGYNLSLALVDAIPVIFFLISGLLLFRIFPSKWFMLGISLSALAGSGKVLWKILLIRKMDFFWLNRQFRFLMPAGFGFLLISILLNIHVINWNGIGRAVISFPSLLFFVAGIIGMIAMTLFIRKLDDSLRSNWIEQLTNMAAQLMFLLGIAFIVF